MRRAAACDRNQAEIMDAFRALGFSVASLHRCGQGMPDLLLGKQGKNYLIECKDGNKSPSKRKLNDVQREFHDAWRGQIAVIETLEDAARFYTQVF